VKVVQRASRISGTRMWTDAQRDGRPATARVPFSNAANIEVRTWTQSEFCIWQNSVREQEPGDGQASCKVWLTAVEWHRCSNEAKMQNPLKFAEVSQTRQPVSVVSDQSSPYCEDMWRRYCCLTSFFPDRWYMPLLQRYSPTKLWDGACPVFSASHVQHISDMHSKFTQRPHHVWKYVRHRIRDCWE